MEKMMTKARLLALALSCALGLAPVGTALAASLPHVTRLAGDAAPDTAAQIALLTSGV